MYGEYFYEIPVYRLDHSRYKADLESYLEKNMYHGDLYEIEEIKKFYEKYPENKIQFSEHLKHKFGGIWKYNEIIGYIALYFLGSQIRGAYFQIKARRIVRTRHKIFEHRTYKLSPELSIPYKASSSDIYEIIKKYLENCSKRLGNRYIDIASFEAIGPFVDWCSLYNKSLHKDRG